MERDEKINELLKKIDILSLEIEKYREELNLIKHEVHGINNHMPADATPVKPPCCCWRPRQQFHIILHAYGHTAYLKVA